MKRLWEDNAGSTYLLRELWHLTVRQPLRPLKRQCVLVFLSLLSFHKKGKQRPSQESPACGWDGTRTQSIRKSPIRPRPHPNLRLPGPCARPRLAHELHQNHAESLSKRIGGRFAPRLSLSTSRLGPDKVPF